MLPRTGVPSDGLALELRGEEGGGGEQRVRTTTKINKMSSRCFSLFDMCRVSTSYQSFHQKGES